MKNRTTTKKTMETKPNQNDPYFNFKERENGIQVYCFGFHHHVYDWHVLHQIREFIVKGQRIYYEFSAGWSTARIDAWPVPWERIVDQ